MRLTKKEKVSVYQVAMELLTKTKQSPFIAILLRANELEQENLYTTAADIRETLLPNLPERACYNLLSRLAIQGYFEEYDADDANEGAGGNFEITKKGIESAEDKSIWQGEKGIYNVYITRSKLIEQQIIAIVSTDRQNNISEKDKAEKQTPKFITNFEDAVFNLKNTEQRIEKIENKCFQLPDEVWDMEILAKESENAVLKMSFKNNNFSLEMYFTHNALESGFLTQQFENDYQDNHVLVDFDANNLLFIRDAFIEKPNVFGEIFDDTMLKNIKYRPSTKSDAEQWYAALLGNNIERYFMNDADFLAHSKAHADLFETHFKLKPIAKQDLIRALQKEKESFYRIAKLETIDFLNF